MFNYRHPSPRREEGGLRAAGQVALCADPRDTGIPGDEFREAIFCRQASKMRAIGPELEAHLLTKTWNMPLGSPKSPQGPQLHPKGTQMEPKGSKMDPKVDKVGPKVYFSGLLGKKKAPARDDNQEIGLDHILGVFWAKKKAPARDDHQQIGLEDGYPPSENPNDQWGRRASPGRENTGILHRIAVRIQWTTSRTTELSKQTPDQPPKRTLY